MSGSVQVAFLFIYSFTIWLWTNMNIQLYICKWNGSTMCFHFITIASITQRICQPGNLSYLFWYTKWGTCFHKWIKSEYKICYSYETVLRAVLWGRQTATHPCKNRLIHDVPRFQTLVSAFRQPTINVLSHELNEILDPELCWEPIEYWQNRPSLPFYSICIETNVPLFMAGLSLLEKILYFNIAWEKWQCLVNILGFGQTASLSFVIPVQMSYLACFMHCSTDFQLFSVTTIVCLISTTYFT